jgi:hypothetical protein
MDQIDNLQEDIVLKLDDIVKRLKNPTINNQQGLPKYYSDLADEFDIINEYIKVDLNKLQQIATMLSAESSRNLGYNGGKRKKRKTRKN